MFAIGLVLRSAMSELTYDQVDDTVDVVIWSVVGTVMLMISGWLNQALMLSRLVTYTTLVTHQVCLMPGAMFVSGRWGWALEVSVDCNWKYNFFSSLANHQPTPQLRLLSFLELCGGGCIGVGIHCLWHHGCGRRVGRYNRSPRRPSIRPPLLYHQPGVCADDFFFFFFFFSLFFSPMFDLICS